MSYRTPSFITNVNGTNGFASSALLNSRTRYWGTPSISSSLRLVRVLLRERVVKPVFQRRVRVGLGLLDGLLDLGVDVGEQRAAPVVFFDGCEQLVVNHATLVQMRSVETDWVAQAGLFEFAGLSVLRRIGHRVAAETV